MYSYGVLPNNFETKFDETTDKIEFPKGYAFCGKTNDTAIPEAAKQEIETCGNSSNFDSQGIETTYQTNCYGQKSCLLNLGKYIKSTAEEKCRKDPARIFIQYSCTQGLQEVNDKRTWGLAIVCLGIFISLIFLLTHWYLKQTAVIDFKVWDVETVTASDFTVEFVISEELWVKF